MGWAVLWSVIVAFPGHTNLLLDLIPYARPVQPCKDVQIKYIIKTHCILFSFGI